VQFLQITSFARAYFAGAEPEISADVDDVLKGQRNQWLPDMRITAGFDWSSFAPATRRDRESSHQAMTGLIKAWQRTGEGFDEVLQRELGAYFQSRQEALLHSLQKLEIAVSANDLSGIVNASHSFVNREVQLIHHLGRSAGVEETGIIRATTEFWLWPKNSEQPFGRILAYLFAALASQFKAGRTKLPSAGFLNDLSAISAYAPYVDAMFVDNECAELLRQGRCRHELSYKAQIFSLNDAEAFIAYLEAIIADTPKDVRRESSALYGLA
jgi:hypothetical protein